MDTPDRPGPEIHTQWTEVSPNSLLATDHKGTLTIGEGREWDIATSWNGMHLIVSTDLSYADDVKPRHGGIDDRRFILALGPLIEQLARDLLAKEQS